MTAMTLTAVRHDMEMDGWAKTMTKKFAAVET